MDNSPMKSSPARLLLIFNPKGVVDKDIWLSSRNGDIRVEAFEIELSKSPEGHTLERIDLLEIGKTILSFDPDFLLTINGGGLDNEGFLSYFCAYLGLPLVLWYVDEPFIIPEWGTKFIPRTTIAFTFDRFYERRLKEWGIPWVHTLPLGANHDRLLGYGSRFPRGTAFRNDVSFVGALEFEKIQYLLKNISTLWKTMPARMPEVLDMALEQYMLNFKQDTDKVVRDCAAALGVDFEYPDGITRQMVLSFIDREASFRLRHKTILSLQPFGIAVYGEPFWKKIVGERSYGGRVDYYSSEIADLYRKSRINLNISKYQLKTTVNQRAFDCPLCGGFLITDFREDVEEFFDIDKDMVVYRDLEELKKRVAFYLENPKQALSIAERGKETVLARHTYKHRLMEMVSLVDAIKETNTFKNACEDVLKGPTPPNFQRFLEILHAETQGVRASKGAL